MSDGSRDGEPALRDGCHAELRAKCNVDPVRKEAAGEAVGRARATFLVVTGIGCINCAHRVRNALLAREGVVQAAVHLDTGITFVAFDPGLVQVPELVEAVGIVGGSTDHAFGATPLGGAVADGSSS